MAINKNHEFEDLNGTKCAIVERKISAERLAFLTSVLETNQYTVVVVEHPAPAQSTPEEIPQPSTYTLGVTDLTFNPINAIFGRCLKTSEGKIVTLAYWQQKEDRSNDEVPYFMKNSLS